MTSLWKIRKRNVFSSVLVLAMAKHNKMFHGTLSRSTCRQETDLEFVKHQHINVLLYLKIKTNRLSPRHPAAEGTNGGGGWFVHSINILCSSKAGCHAYEQKKIVQFPYVHSCDQKTTHEQTHAITHLVRNQNILKMHETLTFTFNMFLQPPPTFILLTLIMNFKEFHRNKKKQKKKQFISEQIHFPRKKELNQKFVGNEISLNISIENLKFRKCTLKNILQSQCKRRNWIYFHSIRREIYFTRRHIEFSNELRHLKIEWSKP